VSAFRTPRGTQDLLPDARPGWDHVIEVFERQCRLFGFERIETPTFENTSLFARAVGMDTDIVGKEMYTFDDRGGDSLTLRPEGTASVVRAYNQHGMKNWAQPVRLYYVTPIYRYDRPQAGRLRQHHQIGAEVLGEADGHVDAEVISLIWTVLGELGLSGLQLNVNSIGNREDRERYREGLLAYYRPLADELCRDCQARLESNPLRLLDCKEDSCQPFKAEAPRSVDFLGPEAQRHFEQVQAALKALGIPFELNDLLVRGLDYYTRTVFEIWPAEVGGQTTIAGGGRYDLLSEFIGGDPLPGVGFGCGIERVLLNLEKAELMPPPVTGPTVYLAPLAEAAQDAATALAGRLRGAGISVLAGYRQASPRSHLRRANAAGVRFAAILGEQELEAGQVALRDMLSGLQDDVAMEDVVEAIQKRSAAAPK
jgi:histidyl-tRNA synthetase